MAPASTLSALSKLFKTVYMNRDLTNLAKRRTPAYDVSAKYDDFYGNNLTFPFNYGLPVGASTAFNLAQASPQPSVVDNWVISTRKTLYGFLTISAEALYASKKDIGAFLSVRQKETQELLSYMKMVLGGRAFWGDGAGNIGKISSVDASNPATLVTLTNARDAVSFYKNQRLQFNPTRTGTAGNLRTDKYQVTTVNRVTGVIGVSRVSGTSNDVVANDFIYLEGTYDAMPLGIPAFVTASDPGTGGVPSVLLGMTRTTDPAMQAGWRGTWQGSIEESAKYLAALMGQYLNKEASAMWLSRYRWFQLEQELSAQGRKVIDAKATQVFGSPALMLLTPEGDVPVVSDPFCPDSDAYLLDHSQIETHHMNPLIHIADDDGLGLLRMTADDGVEIRFRSWSENIVQRPFNCGRFPISAP